MSAELFVPLRRHARVYQFSEPVSDYPGHQRLHRLRQLRPTCPASIAVSRKQQVCSMECTGCLSCVQSCPEHQVLGMGVVSSRRFMPSYLFPLLVLLIFALGVASGMFSGHWHNTLSYRDYTLLIPLLNRL